MKKLIKVRYLLHGTLKFNLTMRLTMFLLVVSLFKIQASTYSQNTKISIDLEKVTVKKVLSEIEEMTEFKFLVNPQEVDLNRIVSVKEKKQRISAILSKLFDETGVIYSVLDKQIVLKLRPEILTPKPAVKKEVQENKVSGTITDPLGVLLPGVNIIKVGSRAGTVSDFEGKYTIVAQKGDVLEFSYLT